MAGLDFCSKHNMVAYLEKNDGNTDFWTSAKSRTVNNISYIDAIVDGKPVTISEASIRSDLLFDDADGIDTLNNQAIFNTIQLMGPSSSIPIPDSNPEGSSGNHGTQAAEIKDLKAQIKQLKKKTRPVINHHKAWFRAARLKKQQKKKDTEKLKKRRSVSKQGRKAFKSSKGAPSVHTHTEWDAMDTDLEATLNNAMDYTQDGDTLVVEDKGSAEKGGSTKVPTPTPTVFGDDETIAQVLVTMSQNKLKQKEKGVELKNVEDIETPRPTLTRSLLTLKPLPKIDPKAKGKGMIKEEDESNTESEDINEAEKKFKMLANDEETAKKV
ncbi:hypothetical protein Tco_0874890 [Tanacetum coccineum]|uniref:Uncharacterized protein n=1 Tax=Tanacetum coccineum TaxID=301880 RepID=A0ABQ5BSS6_9ASTR